MFDLHDNTKKWICRVGFFALALLPTMSVLAWSSSHFVSCYLFSGAVKRHQQQLSERLGMQVEIASVSYPRPGQTRYESLRLINPDTDCVVFQCQTLEIRRKNNDLVLVATDSEMDATGLAGAWRLIAQKLRTDSLGRRSMLRFFSQQLTLHGHEVAQTMTDVVGQIAIVDQESLAESNDVRATLRYRVAGMTSSQPAWILIGRKVTVGEAGTYLDLNTQETQLPLALLRSLLPATSNLGDEALFRGLVWAEETANGWHGKLAGELTHVDLNRLVTENFPHKLSGAATITGLDAQFDQGRLLQAGGVLTAGPGVVEKSLLKSASRWLGLEWITQDDRQFLRYDNLAAHFQVDRGNLLIKSASSHSTDGSIISASSGPLLRQESDEPQSLLNLVRMLVPRNEVQVPATKETDWLLGRLPLPTVIEPVGDSPRARLRFDHIKR